MNSPRAHARINDVVESIPPSYAASAADPEEGYSVESTPRSPTSPVGPSAAVHWQSEGRVKLEKETTRIRLGSQHVVAADKRRATSAFEEYASWRYSKWTPDSSRNTARWWVLVISVFADVGPCGALVVSRPAGGLIPALISFFVFGAASLYGAHLVARAMTITGCTSLADVWRQTVGHRTAWVPLLCITFVCFSCSCGLANFYGELFAQAFHSAHPLASLFTKRGDFWTVVFALFPMTFLVVLKDISVMWWSTALAGLSAIFVCIVVVVRCVDGSYAPGGAFDPAVVDGAKNMAIHHASTSGNAAFSGHIWQWDAGSLPLFSVQSVVFLTHFNAAKYYTELQTTSKERFTRGVGIAMFAGFLVTMLTMVFCYATFGSNSSPVTLDNYATNDTLVCIARVFLAFGLMGCFPLLFSGMRESLVELIGDLFPDTAPYLCMVLIQNALSLCLLALVIVCVLFKHNDVVLINFGRSTFGALLIYVIPEVIYVNACRKYLSWSAIGSGEIFLLMILVGWGIVCCITSSVYWIGEFSRMAGHQ